MLKQIGLLTAGAQPWNSDICTGNNNYFAYCATLAIYIYQLDKEQHYYYLSSIMCEHKKTITSIKWSPSKKDIFMSVSTDQCVIIYDVNLQQTIARCDTFAFELASLEWYPYDNDTISILSTDGKIYLWKYSTSLFTTFYSSPSNACIFKWNKKVVSKLCLGNSDGSITIVTADSKPGKSILSTLETSKEKFTGKEKTDCVIAMEWDPLSTDYILVSTEYGILRLIDTAKKLEILIFRLPKQEQRVRRLCWFESAPGLFLTGDINSGMLRLWSVANESPILNQKVKETGFHCIQVIDDPSGTHSNKVNSTSSQNNLSSHDQYAIPSAKVVSVFRDGGVGVYELKSKQWLFLRDKGHVETIFDCSFHPDNPDLLATASFDGTVKVWDVTTMEMKYESPGNLSIIYSIAWAPGDLNFMCVATSKNGVVLWNVESNQLVRKFNDHGNKSVYHCAWNYRDSRYFASVGGDNNCIINTVDAKLTRRYAHPMAVYGCDWNPKNRDLIATACEDAILRVFYLSSNKSEALKSFKGHTAKIFGVKWCPSKDGILCTGSDDRTIRIWDYCQDECLHCLEGHTAPVRGLLWNPEIPNILLSGSWDYSLKVWDTRTGYCLDTSHDHAADVYGLSCHSQRPFLIASTSRDSTVRMWSLEDFSKPVFCMLLSPISEGSPLIDNEEGNKIWNEMSGNAKAMIQSKSDVTIRKKLHLYSHLFLPPFGVGNLWLLVSILKEKKVILPDNYDTMIMHSSHVRQFKESKAKELETARSNFRKIMGPKTREKQLISAAEIYLQIGDVRSYCEIMIELERWERAICMAPAVSMEYWKDLVQRYASVLDERDDEKAVMFSIATHDFEKVCDFYSKRHRHHDAMVAALVASNQMSDSTTNNQLNGIENSNVESHANRKLYIECNETLSEAYLQCSKPCLSACCYLSFDDTNGAVRQLLRGNEIELAYSVMKIFDDVNNALQREVVNQLARRCERYKMWHEAVTLLKSVNGNEFYTLLCCSRYPVETMHQRNQFLKESGLSGVEEYEQLAAKTREYHWKLLYSLVCGEEEDKIVDACFNYITEILSKSIWNVDSITPYIEIMSSASQSCIQRMKKKRRLEILTLCAYVGGLKAIQLELYPVVTHLLQHACSLMNSQPTGDEVLKLSTVQKELDAWIVNRSFEKSSNTDGTFHQTPTTEQIDTYKTLLTKCGMLRDNDRCLVGDMVTACDRLPSHCDTIVNFFDKKRITGPCFVLEDGKSRIPLSIALMWARVNMFSPLATGSTINPF